MNKFAFLSAARRPAFLCVFVALAFISCNSDIPENSDTPEKEPWLWDVRVENSYTVDPEGVIAVEGKGFAGGDRLLVDGSEYAGASHTLPLSEISAVGASFILPAAISTGDYDLTAIREGEEDLPIGTRIKINVNHEPEEPEPDPTVTGQVLCGGLPLEGVVVSDGYEVVKTDGEGRYAMVSEKKSGFVFISIPAGYMPRQIPGTNMMEFFRRLEKEAGEAETHDFELFAENNDEHTMVIAADFHLANRTYDKTQLKAVFLPEMNGLIEANTAIGAPTYVLTLGDLTWDAYWASLGYTLDDFASDADILSVTDSYGRSLPFFNCMGNHDNDPAAAAGADADWNGENEYRKHICPVYYSFNAGRVHYIVIDDIVYLNAGGSRNYSIRFASHQMEWLKKDLAAVEDRNTPIVVGTHANLLGVTGVANNDTGNAQFAKNPSNYDSFMECFRDFTDVTIFTGHSHKSFNIIHPSFPNIIERNIPSVCATWWWTGRHLGSAVQVCMNGAPGGVGILSADGSDTEYRFQGFGLPPEKQFRTYDRNTIEFTAERYGVENFAGEYVTPYETANSSNQVIINVWNWGPGWTVAVTENTAAGKQTLAATPLYTKDPYHIVTYNLQRLRTTTPTSSFATVRRHNFFTVTASAPDTTLDITVKDEYGHEYTEEMTRPKKFPVTTDEIKEYYFK